jgi:hypothetical protein
MKRVEARKYPPNDGSLALGLDTEWKVIFKRGGTLYHLIPIDRVQVPCNMFRFSYKIMLCKYWSMIELGS